MQRNMSTTDRGIRLIIAIELLVLVFVGPQTAWGYLGLIPLATALVGYCPLYRLLHFSTKRPAPGAVR
jgi:hypothetical protein